MLHASTRLATSLTSLPLTAITALVLGCGDPSTGGAADASGAVPGIAGRWAVSGTTQTLGSTEKRDIEGTIVLAQDGETWASTFDLTTTLPGSDPAVSASVIGKGTGNIEGRKLAGRAHTQLVASTIPGVDSRFPFMPHAVSEEIESTTVATLLEDGTMRIEIENRGEGESSYVPTRTILTGRLLEAESLPDVAAAP